MATVLSPDAPFDALSILRAFVEAARPTGMGERLEPSSDHFRTDLLGPVFDRAVAFLKNPPARGPLAAVGVRFDRVYGKLTCYPVSTQALLLAEIAGTKTLRPRDLALAQRMGLTVSLAPGSQDLLQAFLAEGA